MAWIHGARRSEVPSRTAGSAHARSARSPWKARSENPSSRSGTGPDARCRFRSGETALPARCEDQLSFQDNPGPNQAQVAIPIRSTWSDYQKRPLSPNTAPHAPDPGSDPAPKRENTTHGTAGTARIWSPVSASRRRRPVRLRHERNCIGRRKAPWQTYSAARERIELQEDMGPRSGTPPRTGNPEPEQGRCRQSGGVCIPRRYRSPKGLPGSSSGDSKLRLPRAG